MIVQIVDNEIKVEKKSEYLLAAAAFAKDSELNDAGCLGAEVFTDVEREDHVYIVQKWESLEAMEKAVADGAFGRHVASLSAAFVTNSTQLLKTVEQ